MDEYEPEDLFKIFKKKSLDEEWSLCDDIDEDFFTKNKKSFIYNGRDMETLFETVKIAHAKRVFTLPLNVKKKIKMIDLERAYVLFKDNSPHLNSLENESFDMFVSRMYI